jgi:PPOX class probable F420-dependent enzyme
VSAALSPSAKVLFDSAEYVTLATIEPTGQPQLSIVWVTRDGDDLLMSTIEGTRKHRNLQRDPRATVLLSPKDAPWIYVEVRGPVTVTGAGGRDLIEALSRKYTDDERYTYDEGTDHVRLVLRITPTRVVEYDGSS